MSRAKKIRRRTKPKLTAKTADPHLLYQLSVQDPSWEVGFIERVFRSERGRTPNSLREDFCGTALLCAEWVKRRAEHTATGIDIDPEPLAWGKRHNLGPIDEPGNRITLLRQDVRDACRRRHDVICAFNFSYWVFRTRDELRSYFAHVRRGLVRDGVFLCDAYGGWEAQEPMLEPRIIKAGFTYVWDQDRFDPITHSVTNHIHFEFKDGTKLQRAFTYEWRFWTLPELVELLQEAGFSETRIHWDTAKDENDERYRVRGRAENQPGWIAYLVAVR